MEVLRWRFGQPELSHIVGSQWHSIPTRDWRTSQPCDRDGVPDLIPAQLNEARKILMKEQPHSLLGTQSHARRDGRCGMRTVSGMGVHLQLPAIWCFRALAGGNSLFTTRVPERSFGVLMPASASLPRR